MANLMVFPEKENEEQLLLLPEVFPDYFINYAHPDDYKLKNGSIPSIEYIFNHRHGKHNRLLARIPWKISDESHIMITWVIDTGAPKHIYVGKPAMDILEKYKIIKEDYDNNQMFVKINNKNTPVSSTPYSHDPANMIGLKMLTRLKLKLYENEKIVHF